jgi:hypothetical protein
MKNLFSIAIMTFASFMLSAQCGPTGGGSGAAGGSFGNTNAGSGYSINSPFGQELLSHNLGVSGYAANRSIYKEAQGSPFLNNESVKGTLVLNDDKRIKDIFLQVDLYTENIIAIKPDGEEIVLNEVLFKEIIIPFEGKDIVYKKTNPKQPNKFYEVLFEDGELVFFKQRYATLREGSDNGTVRREPRFSQRNRYYIKHGEGQVAKVKLKKKDILSNFVDAELYAMKAYAKKKGIKFKDEEDYIAVFEGVYNPVTN